MRSYRNNNKKRYFVWLPFWIALGIVLGIFIGNRFSGFNSNKGMFYGGSKIDAILQYINEAYVDSVNTSDLVEKALPGLIAELDPHSAYFTAKDMEIIGDDLEGHFSGIGVQFVLRNDTVTVVNVIPEGPSQAAGILPGDRIIYVNDSLFTGKKVSNEQVMRSLRGKKDSDVKLGIKRFGVDNLVDITVTRGDIPVNTVDIAYQPAKNIGLIKVNKFGVTTPKEFITAISRLKKQGSESFIVDLRQNTGGSLTSAIQMVNEFLAKGQPIVYTEGRAYPREDVVADGSGTSKKDNLVVLLDEGSASASEVFAGAIQDNDRGLIVGRRSYGKGLVQNQQNFKDGSALRLTIARYHTPSGRCVQKPYEMGKISDYNQDLMNRYLRGEFDSQDSIKQTGEPLFHTFAGRPVYGNGGIMPDVFIPRDTVGVNSYYINVANNGLIYESAFLYTDKNRKRLELFKNWEELDAYLSYQPLVQNLVSLADSKGIRNRPYLINEARPLLMTQLKANIIRNIFGEEAFFAMILRDDIVLKKAIELIQNNKANPTSIKSESYRNK